MAENQQQHFIRRKNRIIITICHCQPSKIALRLTEEDKILQPFSLGLHSLTFSVRDHNVSKMAFRTRRLSFTKFHLSQFHGAVITQILSTIVILKMHCISEAYDDPSAADNCEVIWWMNSQLQDRISASLNGLYLSIKNSLNGLSCMEESQIRFLQLLMQLSFCVLKFASALLRGCRPQGQTPAFLFLVLFITPALLCFSLRVTG